MACASPVLSPLPVGGTANTGVSFLAFEADLRQASLPPLTRMADRGGPNLENDNLKWWLYEPNHCFNGGLNGDYLFPKKNHNN